MERPDPATAPPPHIPYRSQAPSARARAALLAVLAVAAGASVGGLHVEEVASGLPSSDLLPSLFTTAASAQTRVHAMSYANASTAARGLQSCNSCNGRTCCSSGAIGCCGDTCCASGQTYCCEGSCTSSSRCISIVSIVVPIVVVGVSVIISGACGRACGRADARVCAFVGAVCADGCADESFCRGRRVRGAGRAPLSIRTPLHAAVYYCMRQQRLQAMQQQQQMQQQSSSVVVTNNPVGGGYQSGQQQPQPQVIYGSPYASPQQGGGYQQPQSYYGK